MTLGDDLDDAARTQLLDLYKVSVDEYRFQVQLNWDRAKYLLGFNTAVISVGTGLLKVGSDKANPLVIGVFAVGVIAAVMSIGATYIQHAYYRTTRDKMLEIGKTLKLGPYAVASTPGAQDARLTTSSRLGKVQNILFVLLTAEGLVGILAIIYIVWKR